MKRALLVVVAAIAAVLLPPPSVLAAPKAENPAECGWYWDIAITARAHAMEGVDRETARRAIWRIFISPLARMRVIGDAVVDAVFSTPWSSDESPGYMAKKIKDACMENRGDMNSILGDAI